jgi:hypothetical protein
VPAAACCQKTAWLRLLDPRRCRSQLHKHHLTRQIFPPKGNTATFLTLVAAAVAVFLLARTLLGAVAAPGGPIFALMLLTLVCVMAGQAVKMILYVMQEMTGMAATFPPFVGMFIIGIVLRNVPYNLVTLAYNSECSTLAELQLQAEAHVHTMNVLMDDDESEQSHHQLSTATTATTTAAMTMTTADCTHRYIGEDLHPAITVVMRVACLNGIPRIQGVEKHRITDPGPEHC